MAKQTTRGMGISLDEQPDPRPAADPAAADARPRQDRRPVCCGDRIMRPGVEQPEPIPHGVAHLARQMTATSSNAMFTRYRCPDCGATAKLVRPIGPLKKLYGHGKIAK